jgi:hypothetical protein
MKSTNIVYSVLGAISAVTVSAVPTFAQTTVPITGGSFTATVTSGVTTFNSGTALTSFGTITFSSVTGGTTTAPSAVIGSPVVLSNGISSGSIGSPSQPFTNALLNINGTISSVSNPSINVFNVGANVNSGNIVLSNSLVSSLSGTGTTGTGTTGAIFGTTGIFGSTGGSSSTVTESNKQLARNILGLQPVPDVEQYFLPPSGLAGSRIHPDVFAK